MKTVVRFLIPWMIFFLIINVFTACVESAKATPGVVDNYLSELLQDEDKTLSPFFVVLGKDSMTDLLPLKKTTADVHIAGVIADASIHQQYVNTGKNTLEAIYVFPLSTKAAVYAMRMKIGSRTIVAQIREKEQARRDYEKARNEGKRVSLLEQDRPNVFTMKVGNIIPGDTITIELKYTELLIPENGKYSFVFPTVVGPRYINPNAPKDQADMGYVNTLYTHQGEAPLYEFDFNLKIDAGIPVQDVTCHSHRIITQFPDLKTALVRLDPIETKAGNRDIIIDYSLQGNKIESGLLLYENSDERYFLMMVQPPKRVAEEEIPPREYIFIVDVSGSMHGFPLNVSKKLVRNLIMNLKPTDKFNVLVFAGSSGLLSEKSIDANTSNIEKAISFIEKQQGGGGTELLSALERAIAIPRPNEHVSRSLVLLSDGYVSVEHQALDLIRKNNQQSNFFSFGIGSGVNRYLMEGLAFMGNGEALIVNKAEVAEMQAEKFRSYIQTPVLSNIKIDFGDWQVYDVEPGSNPDLMAERPLIVFGKYKGLSCGTITITGNTGAGDFKKTMQVAPVWPDKKNNSISLLWAKERIRLLEYYASGEFSSGENEGLKKQITELGLKYGLVTSNTSFIAMDEVVAMKNGKRVTVKQPIPLPEGVSDMAIEIDTEDDKDMQIIISAPVSSTVEEESETVFVVVESMPSFPGGEAALIKYLSDSIKYPETARVNKIQGRVILQFTIGETGQITDVQVVRSVSPELDAEAVRVIQSMPRWIPGKQRGKTVAVKYTLPVTFRLQ